MSELVATTQLEPFSATTLRHIGEILQDPRSLIDDPLMIKRGAQRLVAKFQPGSSEIPLTEFLVTLEENYGDVEDLTLVTYQRTFTHRHKFSLTSTDVRIDLMQFPLKSKIRPVVFDIVKPLKHMPHSNDDVDLFPDSIASFTGPTFSASTGLLPNNGFFHRDYPEAKVAFADTNPPGLRRGAFGFKDDGEVVLMSDEQKWQVVNNGFQGFKAVVGTPNYIKEGDYFMDRENCSNGNLGYLFTYRDKMGRNRVGYTVSSHSIRRLTMFVVLQDFVNQQDGHGLFGLEMEYSHANGVIKKSDGSKEIIGADGFRHRRDRYVVTELPSPNP